MRIFYLTELLLHPTGNFGIIRVELSSKYQNPMYVLSNVVPPLNQFCEYQYSEYTVFYNLFTCLKTSERLVYWIEWRHQLLYRIDDINSCNVYQNFVNILWSSPKEATKLRRKAHGEKKGESLLKSSKSYFPVQLMLKPPFYP